MKKHFLFSKRLMAVLLPGLLVALVSMATFIGVAGASADSASVHGADFSAIKSEPMFQEDDPQKECADCHPDVAEAWQASPHAHAFDDAQFNQQWTSMGKPGECLACHTTNFQSSTNSYTAEGVQCEACHGAEVGDHPPAVVPVKADTEYCGSCHTTTLGEWRLTGHSTAGVGCMDCHDPHSQGALFDDPDEMCLNCHRDAMGDYLEDLHIQKDIGCVDCHALVIPPNPLPEDGIVPTGHAFTITTSTCVACHTDALHAGFSLPGYENGAKAANGHTGESGETQPVETEATEGGVVEAELSPAQHIQALEATLASSRFSSLFQGGIIGLVLGGLTVYYLSRNQARRQEDEGTGRPVDAAHEADGEMVDKEMEKALVFIERGLEWVIRQFRKLSDWALARFSPRKRG